MKHGQIKIHLSPQSGDAYTRLQLCGSVPTAIPRKSAARLARGLSLWSGWPVACVLSVDREAACWCEWWTDLLADISGHHLELRYRVRRGEPGRGER